ncbi:hypothetical protein NQ043_00080 [Staphylococcus hyicus]|nr:hypothetical protein [Staphylococcus hyicus]
MGNNDHKWYKSTWFTILMLIFIFPLGLFLMWKYTNWKQWVKVIITVLIAILVTASFTNNSDSSNSTSKSEEATTEELTKGKRQGR